MRGGGGFFSFFFSKKDFLGGGKIIGGLFCMGGLIIRSCQGGEEFHKMRFPVIHTFFFFFFFFGKIIQ